MEVVTETEADIVRKERSLNARDDLKETVPTGTGWAP